MTKKEWEELQALMYRNALDAARDPDHFDIECKIDELKRLLPKIRRMGFR